MSEGPHIIELPTMRSPGEVMHAKATLAKMLEDASTGNRKFKNDHARNMVMYMSVALQWVCNVEHKGHPNPLQHILDNERQMLG